MILTNTRTSRRRSTCKTRKPKKSIDFFKDDKIAHMIYEHFRIAGTNESGLELSDLANITLREDDVQGCDTK